MIQTQSRTRTCNVAQCGGSTYICTSTGSSTQSCNNNCCREFYTHLLNWHCTRKSLIIMLGSINVLVSWFPFYFNHHFQLWTPLGLVGVLGIVAVDPVVAGWVLLEKTHFNTHLKTSDSIMFMLKLIASYDSDSEQNKNLQCCPMWWKHIHLHKHRIFNTILQQQWLWWVSS